MPPWCAPLLQRGVLFWVNGPSILISNIIEYIDLIQIPKNVLHGSKRYNTLPRTVVKSQTLSVMSGKELVEINMGSLKSGLSTAGVWRVFK